jgi:ribose transport system substrate-binding protein
MSMFGSGRAARAGAAMALLSAIALVISGCSSSGSKSSSTSGAPTGGQTTPADPGVQAATAYLSNYTSNPTSIGALTPLSAKPAAGKNVIYLAPPIPTGARLSQALGAACKALGWNYSQIGVGATPATAASAFDAAIAQKPDAIIFAGLPAAVFTKQIAEAKAAGIAVVSAATGDGPVDGVLADLGGSSLSAVYGKVVAAYFVEKSQGKGKALLVTISAYPILTAFVDSFQSAVREWCPACSVNVLQQQVTDVGTRTPTNVVGNLQRDRSIKWVVISNGDLTQGLSPALKQAGLRGIQTIGEVPEPANLANIKAGTELAWAGYPIDILGWRIVDTIARHIGGADVAAAEAVQTPVQMVTPDNANSVVLGTEGFYVGVNGYQQQFVKLWKVG